MTSPGYNAPSALPPRGQSVASALSVQLEEATDAYANACDDEAEKENEYLRVFSICFLKATADKVPATVRQKTAEVGAVDERMEWNLTIAAKRSAKAKCDELSSRLIAALAHQKLVAGQT